VKDGLDEQMRLEIVADIFEALRDQMGQPSSFRYLIYNRLGFSVESGAYVTLLGAGGLEISNMCYDYCIACRNKESGQ